MHSKPMPTAKCWTGCFNKESHSQRAAGLRELTSLPKNNSYIPVISTAAFGFLTTIIYGKKTYHSNRNAGS